MDNYIGCSKLKALDYNDFFKRKRIIDELEGSLTITQIYDTNSEAPTIAVEENSN